MSTFSLVGIVFTLWAVVAYTVASTIQNVIVIPQIERLASLLG